MQACDLLITWHDDEILCAASELAAFLLHTQNRFCNHHVSDNQDGGGVQMYGLADLR